MVAISLLIPGMLLTGCKPPAKSSSETVDKLFSQLAGARIDAARTQLDLKRPDAALALLVSALQAERSSQEARDLAESILKETVWNFPALTLPHPSPIEQINSAGPSSLWGEPRRQD